MLRVFPAGGVPHRQHRQRQGQAGGRQAQGAVRRPGSAPGQPHQPPRRQRQQGKPGALPGASLKLSRCRSRYTRPWPPGWRTPKSPAPAAGRSGAFCQRRVRHHAKKCRGRQRKGPQPRGFQKVKQHGPPAGAVEVKILPAAHVPGKAQIGQRGALPKQGRRSRRRRPSPLPDKFPAARQTHASPPTGAAPHQHKQDRQAKKGRPGQNRCSAHAQPAASPHTRQGARRARGLLQRVPFQPQRRAFSHQRRARQQKRQKQPRNAHGVRRV